MAHAMQIYRPTVALIHLENLAHNVRLLRNALGENVFFCPMVKANAYGHGDVDVALRLEREGITIMGVGLIEEGILLRQMGVRAELLVFGTFDSEGYQQILKWKLTPVLSLWNHFEIIENQGTPVDVHLKFDTGMHRMGFTWKETEKIFNYVNSRKNIFKVKGILTHLHSAEDADDPNGKSFAQLRRFLEVENRFASLNPISHTLNSAGLLHFIRARREGRSGLPGISLNQGVRPGLAIYGYSPLGVEIAGIELKPVMSLRSQVIRYHEIQAGEGVSYGQTWRAGRASIVGVVPIGYADGYHRMLSNQGAVLFEGHRVPVVGNVCMDYLIIDVTDVLEGQSLNEHHQSEVTLFGYDSRGNMLKASEIAGNGKTITWEVLTSVGERVPRVILENNQTSSYQLGDVKI